MWHFESHALFNAQLQYYQLFLFLYTLFIYDDDSRTRCCTANNWDTRVHAVCDSDVGRRGLVHSASAAAEWAWPVCSSSLTSPAAILWRLWLVWQPQQSALSFNLKSVPPCHVRQRKLQLIEEQLDWVSFVSNNRDHLFPASCNTQSVNLLSYYKW